MTEPTRLIISEACVREGINFTTDTELRNITPGVYEFTNYQPDRWGNCKPERVTAIVKGIHVRIQR